MRKYLITVILALCFIASWNSFCRASLTTISGTVVDADTSEPVEGAVVVFEWHLTKGLPGMTYTERYKTVETVTNSNGRFTVPRVINPLVSDPYFVIYKKSYYCWRAEWDPMTDAKRKDFSLSDNLIYEMDKHVPGKYLYRYSKFSCDTGIHTSYAPLFSEAILWEHDLVGKELQLFQKKIDSLPPEEREKINISSEVMFDYQKRKAAEKESDEIQNRLWKEVLQELYVPVKEKDNK